MKNLFNHFFASNNDNYDKAKSSLNKIKKGFDGFILSFPDITPEEIIFIKEKWENLPKTISKGVKVMGLNMNDNYKSLLTHYKPNSYIKPHNHLNEFENGFIIEGALMDELTGEVYFKGDTYIFPPKQSHYLISLDKTTLIYSTLSPEPNIDIINLIYKDLK